LVYTLTLNPAIDYVVQLPAPLAPGSINRSTGEDYQFGGKGINVSNVLRTLDIDTTALGFIAGFTGEALQQGLQDMGLVTNFIPLSTGHTRINVKIKGREETEVNGSGPMITEADMALLYRQLDTLVSADMLVLSGSVPGCLPQDTYARILSRLQGKEIPTVVDAAGDLLLHTLPYRPFLIKPNREELEAIFDTTLVTDEQITACAKALQDKGARNVLVSMAGNGALLADETGKVHRIQSPSGQVHNSVGAGDSMVAGFLAGWLKTGSYAHALRLGTAAGSATAFSLGLASKDKIDSLFHSMA